MKLESTNIVLIGGFNPNIIQPMWLSQHGVVDETREAFEAQLEVSSHSRRWRFVLDGFNWEVSNDRILIGSEKSISPVAMCIRLFELLPHTPVSAVGVNFSFRCNRKSWTQPIPTTSSSESITELLGDSVSSTLVNKTKLANGAQLILTMTFTETEVEIRTNFHRDVSNLDEALLAMNEFDNDLNYARKICIALSKSGD